MRLIAPHPPLLAKIVTHEDKSAPKIKLHEQRIKTQEKRRMKIELHEQRKSEIKTREERKNENRFT